MDMNMNSSDSDQEIVVLESNPIVNNKTQKEAYFTETSSGSDSEGNRYSQTGRVYRDSQHKNVNTGDYSDTDSEELCEIENMSKNTTKPIPIPLSTNNNKNNNSDSKTHRSYVQSPLPGRSILFSPEHMNIIEDIQNTTQISSQKENKQKICDEAVQSLIKSVCTSIEKNLKPNILSTNTITKAVLLGIQELEQLEGSLKAKQKVLIQAFNQLIQQSQTEANKLILQSYVRDGIVADIIELVYNIIETSADESLCIHKTKHKTKDNPKNNLENVPVKKCKDIIKIAFNKCLYFTSGLSKNNVKIETNIQNPVSQVNKPSSEIAI